MTADDEAADELPNDRSYRRKPIGPFAIVAGDIWSNAKVCRAGADGALVFIFALTVNARRGRTGSFPASDVEPWYLARQLGMDEPRAIEALRRAVAARLLEIDEDTAFVVGWDETWARHAIDETTARQLRRQKQREQSETKTKTKIQRETQTQKKKKRSPDGVRTSSGQGVRVARSPLTADEDAEAGSVIIQGLGPYGIRGSTVEERHHVAQLLRDGSESSDLVQLMRFLADDGGAGWYGRRDSDGRNHMRGNVNVLCILSPKHIARYQAQALGDWSPSERLMRWMEDNVKDLT